MTRREVIAAGGTLCAGALLGAAGCGETRERVVRDGRLVLTWWDYYTEGGTLEGVRDQLAAYVRAEPGVAIDRRAIPFDQLKPTLLRAAIARRLPDIAVIDNPDHQSFAAAGVLTDIGSRVREWGEGDNYLDGPWQSCRYEDRQYGIPNSSNCLALFYNEEMLREASVRPPSTWAELRAAAERLTTDSRAGLAVSAVKSEEGTFQFLPFLWQAGADLDSLDSPEGHAALGLWTDLVRRGHMSRGILGWRQEDVRNEFVNGRVAMMVNGPWQLPVLRADSPRLRWGVAPLPAGRQRASILGGENMAITAGSPNVDAAFDLLTWLQEPGRLARFLDQTDRLPSRRDVAGTGQWRDDPVQRVFIEQLEIARPRAYGPNYPEISTAVQVALQAAISGESDVGTALRDAQEVIGRLLARPG